KAMKEVLRDVLRARGWEEVAGSPGKLRKKGEKGEEQTFDLDSLTVTTELAAEETIKKEKVVEVMGDAWRKEDIEQNKERLRKKTADDLEKRLAVSDEERAGKREELEKAIASRLSEGEKARKTELNGALL